MKIATLIFLLATVVLVHCGHTFVGTNVMRALVFHRDFKYSSKMLQKRVEYLNYTLPPARSNFGYRIQGILAYDKTSSGASVNVTQGGLGFNFVQLRIKSDRGREINYDIEIYA